MYTLQRYRPYHQTTLQTWYQPQPQSKVPNRTHRPHIEVEIGDVVYLHQDLTKNNCHEWYLASSKQNGLVYIRKIAGSQLKANTYKVHEEKCF